MTKITWLGEAEGPPSCTWNGITFPAGEAVEVTDPYMIGKARANRFFEVGEELAPAQAGDEPKMYGPPPVPAYVPPPQWREPDTEADPADWPAPAQAGVSFFDDPPEVPPDYPPEDNPDRLPLKRKRGRPPKVKTNGN